MKHQNRKPPKDHSARRATAIAATAFLVCGLGLAYWSWPSEITEMDEVPLRLHLQAAASALVAIFSAAAAIRAWRQL